MVVSIPTEYTLEVCAEAVPPQDFHATCSVQIVLGLIHIKEHPEKGFVEDSHQMLVQIGLQCRCARPLPLLETMQGFVEGDGNPEAGIYDGGNHITYHIHQPNYPVVPPPLLEEDYGGPGQILW